MKFREDLVLSYKYYHDILELIFAEVFRGNKYDYSILFGPILAQTIGRLYNRDITLFQICNSNELKLGKDYGAHLDKYLGGQSTYIRKSNFPAFIRSIFSITRWLIYFVLVVIKIRVFRSRSAVDICDSKPDVLRRLKYLVFTKYIIPPTLSNTIRKFYFKLFILFGDVISEQQYVSTCRNIIDCTDGLSDEDKVVLNTVLMEIPSDEIVYFNANQALARFLYNNFHFDLQNCFYFDSIVAHAICAREALGCTLKVTQHGGGYGILDGNVYELFETEQFGDDFHYINAHDIKNGIRESVPRRWAHLPPANKSKVLRDRGVLVLARTFDPPELLTSRSNNEDNAKLIVQLMTLLRSINESVSLDILPYDDFQGEELNSNPLLDIPNVKIIDRSNRNYKLEEYSFILFNNFGSLFYECLIRGLAPVVVNVFPIDSYQKDWEERVQTYINDGQFVWNICDLFEMVNSKLLK